MLFCVYQGVPSVWNGSIGWEKLHFSFSRPRGWSRVFGGPSVNTWSLYERRSSSPILFDPFLPCSTSLHHLTSAYGPHQAPMNTVVTGVQLPDPQFDQEGEGVTWLLINWCFLRFNFACPQSNQLPNNQICFNEFEKYISNDTEVLYRNVCPSFYRAIQTICVPGLVLISLSPPLVLLLVLRDPKMLGSQQLVFACDVLALWLAL